MATTKNLHLLMTAKSADAEAAMSRAGKGLDQLKAKADKVKAAKPGDVDSMFGLGALKGVGASLINPITAAMGLGGASVGAFASKIRETSKSIEAQADAAYRAGASVEGYSGIMFAAGKDSDAVSAAMDKLSMSIGQAVTGSADMAAGFRDLGLDAQQLAGMQTDQAFLKFVSALDKQENAYARNSRAAKVLGEEVKMILPFLSKGEAEIRRMAELGKSRGAVIDALDAAKIKAAENAWRELDGTADGFWKRLTIELAPAVKAIANDLANVKMPDISFGSGVQEMRELGTWILWLKNNAAGDPFAMENAVQYMKAFKSEAEKAAEVQKRSAEQLRAMNEAQQKLTESKRAEEAVAKRTEAVIAQGAGPYDQFKTKLDEINAVMALGKLTVDQYEMALGALVTQFDRFAESKQKVANAGPELLERGSSAEFSARARFQREAANVSQQSSDRAAKILEQIRDNQREQTRAAKEAAESLRNLKLAKF